MRSLKIYFICFLYIITNTLVYAQGVAISETEVTEPDSSAILDLISTGKGVLVPRLNDSQRNSISNPANGLLIFNTSESSFQYYDSNTSNWVTLQTSTGQNLWTSGTGDNIYRQNGNVGIGTNSPNVKVDINGAIAYRDTTISVTSGNFDFTVGNRTYFKFSSNNTPVSRVVKPSNGSQVGQLLIIHSITSGGTNGISLSESSSSNIDLTASSISLLYNGIITFIWDGSKWIQISYNSL